MSTVEISLIRDSEKEREEKIANAEVEANVLLAVHDTLRAMVVQEDQDQTHHPELDEMIIEQWGLAEKAKSLRGEVPLSGLAVRIDGVTPPEQTRYLSLDPLKPIISAARPFVTSAQNKLTPITTNLARACVVAATFFSTANPS